MSSPRKPRSLHIPIRVLNLVGDTHIALTELGGITVRGKAAKDETAAVRNLLYALQADDGDSEIALQLALEHTSIGDQLSLDAPDEG